MFVASAALGALAIALTFILPDDRPAPLDDDDDEPSFKQLFALLKNPALLPTYAAIVINMFVVGVLFGFLPVYLHDLGYATGNAGLIVSAATASCLLVQPIAGWLANRVDPALTIIVGLAAAAGATAAHSFKEVGDMLGPLAIGALTQAFGARGVRRVRRCGARDRRGARDPAPACHGGSAMRWIAPAR